MADILNSRSKNGIKLIGEFKNLVKHVNETQKQSILSPLSITLGDEFQGVITTPSTAIDTIIKLEEEIIGANLEIKLRYVMYYGRIDTPINKKTAYEMLGPGLTAARTKLNDLKSEGLRFFIKTNSQKKDDQLNNAFIIYQSIVDQWRYKDYQAVREFVNEAGYKKVAELLNVNPTTAWRKKKSLKIKEYFAIKKLIMSLI